jgi:hypothetical protein
VIANPPLLAGAVQATDAEVLDTSVAMPIVGAPGVVAGMMAVESEDALPVPTGLVAETLNSYEVPLVRPVTVYGLEDALDVTVVQVL